MPPVTGKLPIGIQTLREIRQDGYLYVDKTRHLLEMVTQGKAYFLSRPRRFGKSLFLDTLKEVFEGNQALFPGLHIHDHWDWRQTYPVMKLDFTAGHVASRAALDLRIRQLLAENQLRLGLARHEADNNFSKVSLFSGINQLRDISLSAQYATLCGYTQQDLETTFADRLRGVDWGDLKRWYNGYGFLGETVYNPFGLRLA